MTPEYVLKKLHKDAIAGALERADRYYLLNDPEQTQSICLDILEADPSFERALVLLILAVTEQFKTIGTAGANQARTYVAQLKGEYERVYYLGIVAEREGRAFLARAHGRAFAFELFAEAMQHYEEARELAPAGNHDASLRWNSCARTIMGERLEPRPDEPEQMLE